MQFLLVTKYVFTAVPEVRVLGFRTLSVQSGPIKMRAPILYLANYWIDSKMLLTPDRFSYLVILLLVAFH